MQIKIPSLPDYVIESAVHQEKKLLANIKKAKADIKNLPSSGLSEDLVKRSRRQLDESIRSDLTDLRKIRIPLGTSRSKSEVSYRDEEFFNKDKDKMFSFADDFPEFPMGCNDVTRILIKNGVVSEEDSDSESGCAYMDFKTREEGEAFIDRLNKFLMEREAVSICYGLYED